MLSMIFNTFQFTIGGLVCVPGRGSSMKVESSDDGVEHCSRYVKRIAEDGDEDEDATRCHFHGVKDVEENPDFEVMSCISTCRFACPYFPDVVC